MKHISILLAFLVTLSAPVAADEKAASTWDSFLAELVAISKYQEGNYSAGLEYFRPLANAGDGNAQFHLGKIYSIRGWTGKDYLMASKMFTLSAEQGNAGAQANLGFMYESGKGVLQDYKEAVRWYTLAAEQGDADAQYNLGFMYYKGNGVLQDDTMAHIWLNIASANGHENGGTNRDKIAKKMTPAAIEKAQAMARKCMSSDYKNCGY